MVVSYFDRFFFLWRCSPMRSVASSFLMRFLDHTQRDITARRRDLYLTTHNTRNRQTSMPPAGFEPTISASERPQTYALDHAAIGTGPKYINYTVIAPLSTRSRLIITPIYFLHCNSTAVVKYIAKESFTIPFDPQCIASSPFCFLVFLCL